MKLKEFALAFVEDFPEIGEWDGFDIFDLAVACEVLLPEQRTTFCDDLETDHSEYGGSCNCREYYSDEEAAKGFECYRLNPELRKKDE